jgi:DNA repair and recombination protein RAD54B
MSFLIFRIGTSAHTGTTLESGMTRIIGGKEIEIDCPIKPSDIPSVTSWDDEFSEDTPQQPLSNAAESFKTVPASFSSSMTKFVAPTSFYASPVLPKKKPNAPLHDPNTEGAVIMKAPTKEHEKQFNKK